MGHEFKLYARNSWPGWDDVSCDGNIRAVAFKNPDYDTWYIRGDYYINGARENDLWREVQAELDPECGKWRLNASWPDEKHPSWLLEPDMRFDTPEAAVAWCYMQEALNKETS